MPYTCLKNLTREYIPVKNKLDREISNIGFHILPQLCIEEKNEININLDVKAARDKCLNKTRKSLF